MQGSCVAYPQIVVQERSYDGDGEAWSLENRYSIRATDHFLAARWRQAHQDITLGGPQHRPVDGIPKERRRPAPVQPHPLRRPQRRVSVSLGYDAQGRLKDVRDHFGTEVLTYHYSGDLLSEIRDNPALISATLPRPAASATPTPPPPTKAKASRASTKSPTFQATPPDTRSPTAP